MNLGFDTSSFKNFDLRSLKKLADPKSSEDLNQFLEALPKNAGQTILIIAGVVWAAAGALGLFTTIQVQKLTELSAEFEEAEAQLPPVPVVRDVPVRPDDVKEFAESMNKTYKDLNIIAKGATIEITGKETRVFGQFREAIGHVQNGGAGWRVNIARLCVGRECDRFPLFAELKINKVSVDKAG